VRDNRRREGFALLTNSGVVRATEEVALEWLAAGRRIVQALLVEVEGSAPLPVGAMMLIGDRGEIEGSITGGCVEGAVVVEAEAILAGERGPGLCTYGISDELAGTVGLMCGGIVHVFVAELTDGDREIERAVLASHLAGRPAAVATLISGEQAGGRIGVLGSDAIGALGVTPLLDRNVTRETTGLLAEGKTTTRRFGADGATLGDELPVHIRAYAPPPRMFIFGAVVWRLPRAPM
jgi:xanthine dehydrogenase accessory factor